MNHPDDKLAAYVDGELGHVAREKVLAHLAQCAECRAEAEAQRRIKATLAAAAEPGPSDDLMARLLAVGSSRPPSDAGPAARPPAPGGAVARPWSPAPCRAPRARAVRRAPGAAARTARRAGPGRQWAGAA